MIAKAGMSLPLISAQDAKHVPPYDCPALTEEKQCAIYENRPAICRMWGVSEGTPCIYGCDPEEILPDPEAWWILGNAHGDFPKISIAELERRQRVYPWAKEAAEKARREGIRGDQKRAREVHGPDVKLVDDAQLGLKGSATLDLSGPLA